MYHIDPHFGFTDSLQICKTIPGFKGDLHLGSTGALHLWRAADVPTWL